MGWWESVTIPRTELAWQRTARYTRLPNNGCMYSRQHGRRPTIPLPYTTAWSILARCTRKEDPPAPFHAQGMPLIPIIKPDTKYTSPAFCGPLLLISIPSPAPSQMTASHALVVDMSRPPLLRLELDRVPLLLGPTGIRRLPLGCDGLDQCDLRGGVVCYCVLSGVSLNDKLFSEGFTRCIGHLAMLVACMRGEEMGGIAAWVYAFRKSFMHLSTTYPLPGHSGRSFTVALLLFCCFTSLRSRQRETRSDKLKTCSSDSDRRAGPNEPIRVDPEHYWWSWSRRRSSLDSNRPLKLRYDWSVTRMHKVPRATKSYMQNKVESRVRLYVTVVSITVRQTSADRWSVGGWMDEGKGGGWRVR